MRRQNTRRGAAVRAAAAGAVILAAVCAAAVMAVSGGSSGGGTVGTVNGLAVYADEIVMYADGLRAAVSAEISQEYGLAGTGASFWDTEYGGETPREVLLDRALEELVRNKVIQQQCVERGITAPADFTEMERAMEQENRSRSETAASGGTVYGTTSYTLAQYSEYQMTAAEDDLKTALLEGELAPTEEQLRAAFDEVDESYKRRDFTCSGWKLTWAPTDDDEAVAQQVRDAFAQTGDAQAAAAAVPGVTAEEFSFDSTEVHREDSTSITLSEILFFTEPGECSELEAGYAPAVYCVTEKDGGGWYTYEEAPRLGESKYINDAFDALIDGEVAAAQVDIDREAALEALRSLV